MKSLTRNFGKVLLAASVIFLASCNKDDDSSNNGSNGNQKDETIKETLEKEPDMARMNEAVEESNTSDFFSRTNANITLFAANNNAWNQLFAEAGVSSMSELENSMGEENFRRLVLYLALNGKLSISDFNDGFRETNATNENGSHLDIYVHTEGSSTLHLNGGDNNGAMTVSGGSYNLNNGNIIVINRVARAQNNYENIEESQNENSLFVNIMAGANTNIRNRLNSENQQSTIFLANNDETMESMLSINLSSILSVSDLDQLLDDEDQTSLFEKFGINALADLLLKLRLGDLLELDISLNQILQIVGEEGRSEMMNNIIIAENISRDEMAERNSITTMGGMEFDVNTNNEGNFVLTDDEGNQIILHEDNTQSVNGSIYTVVEVRESTE